MSFLESCRNELNYGLIPAVEGGVWPALMILMILMMIAVAWRQGPTVAV